jgi:hypothetical protein
METIFKRQVVTRENILRALHEFAEQYPDTEAFDNWLRKNTYRYMVRYDGRLYPPKQILSVATGIATEDFSGGEQTNRVFRQLGFDIEDK